VDLPEGSRIDQVEMLFDERFKGMLGIVGRVFPQQFKVIHRLHPTINPRTGQNPTSIFKEFWLMVVEANFTGRLDLDLALAPDLDLM
jgi:hypothetical protein